MISDYFLTSFYRACKLPLPSTEHSYSRVNIDLRLIALLIRDFDLPLTYIAQCTHLVNQARSQAPQTTHIRGRPHSKKEETRPGIEDIQIRDVNVDRNSTERSTPAHAIQAMEEFEGERKAAVPLYLKSLGVCAPCV